MSKNIFVQKNEILSESGYIKVRVITDLGSPLENATVTVYASLKELIPVQTVTTDVNGNAPPLKLPVSYNKYILEMDPVYYYTNYNIRVSIDGYYSVLILNIQVFPTITSQFDVNMTRIPVNVPYPRQEKIIENPKINL